MAYQHLASVYDELMNDAPYDEWVHFTEKVVNKSVKAILDVGCGTGQITRRLSRKGYQMTGVDLSEDMLIEAANAPGNDANNIQWIKQDIRELSGFEEQELVVSFCDVINYLTEEADVKQTFQAIYDSLAKDGQFIFDVHSVSHVEVMSDNLYSEVHDDYSYIWFCDRGDDHGEMYHDLTFFIKEGDCFKRYDEQHHQKTYQATVYEKWLTDIGFSNVTIYKDFETTPMHLNEESTSDRLFFVCNK